MIKLYKLLCLILFALPCQYGYTQGIFVLTDCFPANISVSGNDGGSPVRNIYDASFYRVRWNATRSVWQIEDIFNSPNVVIYESSEPTAPNPPDLATGNWQQVDASCGTLQAFQGTGTQSAIEPKLTYG
ncbi:MAG: hypothetical protein AAF740_10680, partial [Bacteroidota bacterium]